MYEIYVSHEYTCYYLQRTLTPGCTELNGTLATETTHNQPDTSSGHGTPMSSTEPRNHPM